MAKKTRRTRVNPTRHQSVSPDEAFKTAMGHLMNDFGTAAVAIKKAHTTSAAVGRLMCDYVHSLVNGDGSLPAGLTHTAIISKMRVAFVEACEKRLVGKPLPGQNTEWYDVELDLYRQRRISNAA